MSSFLGKQWDTVAAKEDQIAFTWPTAPGWKSYACVNGYVTLKNVITYTDPSLTLDKCQSTCLASGRGYVGLSRTGSTWVSVKASSKVDMAIDYHHIPRHALVGPIYQPRLRSRRDCATLLAPTELVFCAVKEVCIKYTLRGPVQRHPSLPGLARIWVATRIQRLRPRVYLEDRTIDFQPTR